MKITLLSIVILFSISISYAQTTDEEADAIATLLNVQKRQAVAQLVSVHGKDSVAFWKIYSEYEKEVRATGKNRIKLYEATARSYSRMTPAVADSLATKYFTNRQDQEARTELYYKKIKTATNAVVAFEFYQAEIYLLTQLRGMIMQQIPAYGALKNQMKN
jgi:hypothetical protein